LDDPGGLPGDGRPETGQAYLSCFTPTTPASSGTLVIATIRFTAIAAGTSALALTDVVAADNATLDFADCPGAGGSSGVPCVGATVNVH